MYRKLLVGLLAAMLVGQPLAASRVFAGGGDFSLDFVAAAPFTYNHATGGGAYDDRTIGKNNDVVESLEGGDFKCGDWVTFLTQVQVDTGAFAGAQTIELIYDFTADSTGRSGVSFNPISHVAINYGAVAGGDGSGGTDAGIVDDGGSVVSNFSQQLVGTEFTNGATVLATLRVNDLEPGEDVVVRTDAFIKCQPNSRPTGNLQARLVGAAVVAPNSQVSAIPVGAQTIPLKKVNLIDDSPCTGSDCPPPPCTGFDC